MNLWQRMRIALLGLTFGGVVFVFGRLTLFGGVQNSQITAFTFPKTIPLSQWQLTTSDRLSPPTNKPHPGWLAQQRYRYTQNNQSLDIEMGYFRLIGGVTFLLRYYSDISSSTFQVRNQEGIGFYGLGYDKQRAYLSACINPRGNSTFTEQQFEINNYNHAIEPKRILPWLLSEQPLFDKRCLWTTLSVPLGKSSPEAAYPVLERAWVSWYQWWQPRFPKEP